MKDSKSSAKIKERIAALRAKAASLLENRGNASADALENIKNEAQALIDLALKLQTKYAIDDAEFVSENGFSLDDIVFVAPDALRQNIIGSWFQILLDAVGLVYPVRFVTVRLEGNIARIIGDENDCELAKALLELLCGKAVLFFNALAETKHIARFPYMDGFAMGVYDSAKVKKEEAEQVSTIDNSAQDTDLAMVKIKANAVMAMTDAKLQMLDAILQAAQAEQTKAKAVPISDDTREGYHDGLNREKTRL